MKPNYLIALYLIVLISLSKCAMFPSDIEPENGKNGLYSTGNPNRPYTYINGFEKYDFVPFQSMVGRDTVFVNELRFYAVYSAFYTEKVMYDKFGKWDIYLQPACDCSVSLIWKNIKLFDSSEELYTVAASGMEGYDGIYASVVVFNSKQEDCLAENYDIRDSIIEYFSNAIHNLSNDKKFYDVFWKEHRRQKRKNKG